MPDILTRIPLRAIDELVSFGPHAVKVRRRQPIVWISLIEWSVNTPLSIRPFPAIIDTGNNHSFYIRETQFRTWNNGADPRNFATGNRVRLAGQTLDCYSFNIGLNSIHNDRASSAIAGIMQTDIGIAIVPDHFPIQLSLPTIGIRCFQASGLDFLLHGRDTQFTIRTSI